MSPVDDNLVPMGHPVPCSYSAWAAEMALWEVTEPQETQSRVAHLLSKCSAVSVADFFIQDFPLFPDDMDVHHSLVTELAEVNQGRVTSPVLLSQMRSMHKAAVAWDTRGVRPPHRLLSLAWPSPAAAASTIPPGQRSGEMTATPPAFPAALVTAAASSVAALPSSAATAAPPAGTTPFTPAINTSAPAAGPAARSRTDTWVRLNCVAAVLVERINPETGQPTIKNSEVGAEVTRRRPTLYAVTSKALPFGLWRHRWTKANSAPVGSAAALSITAGLSATKGKRVFDTVLDKAPESFKTRELGALEWMRQVVAAMDADVDAQSKRLPGEFQTNLKGETIWRSVPLTVEAWAAHILDYATANKDKFV